MKPELAKAEAPSSPPPSPAPTRAAARAPATLPPWADKVLLPVINLVVAFSVSALVVVALGESPLAVLRILLQGALGNSEGLGYTLYYTANFIFTGLAVAVAQHAGLFNIGGEGQAYIGGLGVTLACLALDGRPWWLVMPVALLAAIAFGALWALVPAYLYAKRGSHIVITTIMFNFISTALMGYLLVTVLSDPAVRQPESKSFADVSHPPFMHELLNAVGIHVGASPLNVIFFVALAACVVVWLLIWRSRLGYELRTLGASPRAAAYAGLSEARLALIAMTISGGLAGLMALNEVLGAQQRLILAFSGGAGFVGIAVAMMGRSHPVGIALAAMLFGVLYQGGAELAFDRPTMTRDIIVIMQALVILFTGALEHLFRPSLLRILGRLGRRAGDAPATGRPA